MQLQAHIVLFPFFEIPDWPAQAKVSELVLQEKLLGGNKEAIS